MVPNTKKVTVGLQDSEPSRTSHVRYVTVLYITRANVDSTFIFHTVYDITCDRYWRLSLSAEFRVRHTKHIGSTVFEEVWLFPPAEKHSHKAQKSR